MSEPGDREIERAFQMLECCGVPRERANTVSNGIDVLSTRCQKEANGLAYEIATIKAKRDELLARLKESTEQLEAMSMSASHAASWVNPRSDATDIQVAKNRAAIASAEKDKP